VANPADYPRTDTIERSIVQRTPTNCLRRNNAKSAEEEQRRPFLNPQLCGLLLPPRTFFQVDLVTLFQLLCHRLALSDPQQRSMVNF
jgi:hypothetical protein